MLLLKIERFCNALSRMSGSFAVVAFLLLLVNVSFNVVMRYVFNNVSIGLQELEWHLYSLVFLFGMSYGVLSNGHVRVDVWYDRTSDFKRAWINIIGNVVLVFPFLLLVIWYGTLFALESWELGELSGDPGGLPARWLIKAAIPVSFIFLLLSSIGSMLTWIRSLRSV